MMNLRQCNRINPKKFITVPSPFKGGRLHPQGVRRACTGHTPQQHTLRGDDGSNGKSGFIRYPYR